MKCEETRTNMNKREKKYKIYSELFHIFITNILVWIHIHISLFLFWLIEIIAFVLCPRIEPNTYK